MRGLNWGIWCSELSNLPKLDVILASDCLFDPSVFEDFLWTLAYLLEKNTEASCFLTYQIRNTDWTIDWLLEKYELTAANIDLTDFHGHCVEVPGFQEEMQRHTVILCKITKK